MTPLRKWLLVLVAVVFVGSLFGDKLITFYIDWLWFDSLGFVQVLWTLLGAQFGLGFAAGILFFLLTYGALRRVYSKTRELPVLLSDQIRREIPFLDLLAANLRPLILFGPLILAIMTGLVISQQWDIVLKYLNAVPFNEVDPIFGRDISFYMFSLPMIQLVKSLLWEALVVIAIGVGLIFFFKRFMYFSPSGFVVAPQGRRTFSLLVCFFFLLLAGEFYIERFEMLMQGNGVVAGISFADDYGQLPVWNILTGLSLVGAILSLFNLFQEGFRKIVLAGVTVGIVYILGNFYPQILQKFVVDPNELVKETPYIEHTIASTNRAYGLDSVEVNVLTGAQSLTAQDIRENKATIENVRLWDQEPLLETLGQIQEIRTYYQFASVDNDRYSIDGKYQQTLLSPRELLSSSLPNRTWINEHLTFTHGYGVSLSPVNQVTPEGLPVLFIKDIPPQSEVDLQVKRPEIYFGELTNKHVFVNTDTEEFDYPKGEKNVYRNYEGKGGFPVSSFMRKVLLAARFKTLKVLFSEDIHNESRVLMYRNIVQRVRKIVPFLRLDNDPYLVISEGRLRWIFDTYTTSDRYPYSEVIPQFGNYIRNSVKVVIDAYDGSMDFYVADPDDPVIQTYRRIFPVLFQDLEAMPEDLRNHIRYPSDLFAIQTFMYSTYHMKTPQVFYNKEDQWNIPEIDGRTMQPYYIILKLPDKEKEEYILMLPFTPRGKDNLSAWMVARSDGEHYGKLVVYTFPKQKLVYGASQIVARINQDAEISRQISLWDQRGSRVIQGTLLVIPIEESLIYVRPLYLKAETGRIPELKRVIVGYEDNIAMEPTLPQALQKIFPDLEFPEKPQTRERVARKPASTGPREEKPPRRGKVVLSQSDYDRIQKFYRRILESQRELDKRMIDYRNDIEALGEVLDSVTLSPEAPQPSVKAEGSP